MWCVSWPCVFGCCDNGLYSAFLMIGLVVGGLLGWIFRLFVGVLVYELRLVGFRGVMGGLECLGLFVGVFLLGCYEFER